MNGAPNSGGARRPTPGQRATPPVPPVPASVAVALPDPGTAAGTASGLHPVELAGLLHELTARLLGAGDPAQALERLAAFAAGAVPGALRCSVALIADGGPLTLAACGTGGRVVDDLQYSSGQGPGLQAARTRELVTVQDLPSDQRWPELAECARAEGVHSVAAVPLDVPRASVGALTVLVARPHAVDPDLLVTAMTIANQAEVLLTEVRRREFRAEGATVDRAVGVIIAQRGCGVQEAYDVLQDTAHRLGLDRRAVAERLIAAAARNADH